MKIAYEPHPVSAERKAELRAQGFKIIDARFAPEVIDGIQAEETEAQAEASPPAVTGSPENIIIDGKPMKRGRPRKVYDPRKAD